MQLEKMTKITKVYLMFPINNPLRIKVVSIKEAIFLQVYWNLLPNSKDLLIVKRISWILA